MYQRKFCEAREILSDNELQRLTDKYHSRHPTFSLCLQERTCKSIILDCIYHYRHIEIDLKCHCVYNEVLHQFDKDWSTAQEHYQAILNDLPAAPLSDQIESVIERLTNYFIRMKPIDEKKEAEETRSVILRPIEHRRRKLVERSVSWSQPLGTLRLIRPNSTASSVFDRKNKSSK